MLFPWILLALAGIAFAVFLLRAFRCPTRLARRRRRFDPPEPTGFATPKPQWVRDEVLRLKALMPGNGCRKIAVTFNHMHAVAV